MTLRRPLVLNAGAIQELQSGDQLFGTGAPVLLGTADVTNVASVIFTLPTGYEYFLVEGDSIVPASGSGANFLQFQTSNNGGTSYNAGTSDYLTHEWHALGTAASSATAYTNSGVYLGDISLNSNFRGAFRLQVDPGNPNYPAFKSEMQSVEPGTTTAIPGTHIMSSWLTASTTRLTNLKFSTGVNLTGSFRLWGVP